VSFPFQQVVLHHFIKTSQRLLCMMPDKVGEQNFMDDYCILMACASDRYGQASSRMGCRIHRSGQKFSQDQSVYRSCDHGSNQTKAKQKERKRRNSVSCLQKATAPATSNVFVR